MRAFPETLGTVVHVDRVRCLECGSKYLKPADGGTTFRNPGCPRCGYLGWISASIPPAAPLHRPERQAAQRENP
jgi:ribosomal protein S27AE